MKQKKKYDRDLVNKAMTSLGLRLVVMVYVAYLGYKMLANSILDKSPIPLWGAWLIFGIFTIACLGFCVYAIRQFLYLRKEAELPDTNENKEKETDGI